MARKKKNDGGGGEEPVAIPLDLEEEIEQYEAKA